MPALGVFVTGGFGGPVLGGVPGASGGNGGPVFGGGCSDLRAARALLVASSSLHVAIPVSDGGSTR